MSTWECGKIQISRKRGGARVTLEGVTIVFPFTATEEIPHGDAATAPPRDR